MANGRTGGSCVLALAYDELDRAEAVIDRTLDELQKDGPVNTTVRMQREREPFGIWFYEEQTFDPEEVAIMASAVLEELKSDEPFVFSWSYTCDKLRHGHFGGGACVVRRGKPNLWVDVEEEARRQAGISAI